MARSLPELASLASTLGTDNLALFHVVQENLRLLAELRATARQSDHGGPLGRRASRPEEIYDLVGPEMENLLQEQVQVILLDTKRHVLDVVMVYQGNISTAIVRPAELLRDAVITNAPSLVLAHNHPSGDPEPSPQDIHMTRDLVKAADILGIEVADHLVIGLGSFVSFKRRGLL